MISFSCLPSDIIYEVAKYISIRDVCILSHASVDLYFKVKGLQTNIIIYNFKKHNKLYNVLKTSFTEPTQSNPLMNVLLPEIASANKSTLSPFSKVCRFLLESTSLIND